MDAARWERIQGLFHRLADLPAVERKHVLELECAHDPELLAEVAGMLEADASGGTLLDRDLALAAGGVLGGGVPPDLPRERFGPYRITGVLGEGGMGVVYLAERSDLGSRAAIKILRDASLSPARRERFASEQRTLAQLNHPGIAGLLDADTLPDGTPWFVMEYVEGMPLTAFCTARGTSVPGRLRLLRSVCEAVQHAHTQAVIHRDLKPSNVLVKPDGTVKLLDFGIAKQLESLDLGGDQTRTGLRMMTPAYAAPEQYDGGRIGIHTDVYALGVILYELLAGRLPFDLADRKPAEAMTIVAQQMPEKPSVIAWGRGRAGGARSVSKAAWSDLDTLCLTAMHKDPARRYRTVEALIRDLDHFLAGEPLEARPDSFGYRMRKFVGRNRSEVAAAALVLAAVVGLVVFYTVRLTRARNTAVAEAARAQRIQRFTLNLFEGGDKEAGPADSLRVVALVERGLKEAQNLVGEPAAQAELYLTLGSIYQKLGNLARADTLLRLALDRRRTLFGAGTAEQTESLVALGLLRADQAKFEESERLIRDALDQGRRRLSPGDPALAQATFALGRVLQDRGNYPQAIRTSEEAVRLYSAPGGDPTPELAASLGQLADDHFYAGHYDASDSVNRIVLAMDRRLYGERHPRVADILINLGAAQVERGNYKEGERFYRLALDITRGFYGDDAYQTASNLTMLGRALVYQNRLDEGADLLRRALAIQERVFGPVHPRVASALNDLGNAAYKQNRLDEAEADFSRIITIYKSVYGDKHYLIGIATANLAGVFLDRKDFPRAERLYREAVARFTEALGPEQTNTGIGRIKLGRTLLRAGRFADAAAESLAGYQIVLKQANPQVSWLVNARRDLVAAYDSLKQPEKAERFRKELAAAAK
ncbi:MAG TPA: serine/threonine-protein kinase [Gemmatimonadales bacterium]|jgi:serine/threonine-protein kinase|nr:serine/threonine-protein kinase [Gemmatimonadales bacterium]